MAFVKKTWKDRIAEFPTRRRLTKEDNTSELVTVAREEGTLSQEGDAFSAENMNDLENRIDAEFTEVNGNLSNKPNKYSWSSKKSFMDAMNTTSSLGIAGILDYEIHAKISSRSDGFISTSYGGPVYGILLQKLNDTVYSGIAFGYTEPNTIYRFTYFQSTFYIFAIIN